MKMSTEPLEILLVEDNIGDVGLIKELFSDAKVLIDLHIAEDGEEAGQFLCHEGKFLGSKNPDLIVLDWNLPRKDGSEVLKEIKENNNLKRIPVIVLTTSNAEKDISKAYEYHANAYLVKPIDFDKFMAVIKSIEEFWFKAATLPPKHSH
jgi:CheY-like chemotaxis protein